MRFSAAGCEFLRQTMVITFHNDGSSYRLRGKRRVAAWVARCIRDEGFEPGEISFVFCSPQQHLEINRRYLGHDYNTDVITFDYSDLQAGMVSGEIFVDPATVRSNAAAYGQTAGVEMLRVLIHGVLHLCGYGDSTDSEREIMRAKEDSCLTAFASI